MWKITLLTATCSTFSLYLILNSMQGGLKDEERPVSMDRGGNNDSRAQGIQLEMDIEDSTLSPEDATLCRKALMVMGKKLMKYYVKCMRETKKLYPDKQDFQDHFSCVLRCSLRETNMINDEFRLTNATVDAFFNGVIPSRFSQTLLTVSKNCRKKYMPLLNGEDPFCKVHGDFVLCAQNTVSDKCVSSEYKIEV